MSRWKKADDEVTPQALYMREWVETEAGKAYKEKSREYSRQWKLNNKERARAIQRRSDRNTRLEVLQHYSELEVPECKCCKEQMFEFLQIDHINNDGANHRRELNMTQGDPTQMDKEGRKSSMGGTGFIYWLKKNGFPEGFQVLCANCNLGKRVNQYCPHEIKNGVDMYGNIISVEVEQFPELTRRKRGEAEQEAEELGVNKHTLRMRKWREKKKLERLDEN
jgi:hypothetical protein